MLIPRSLVAATAVAVALIVAWRPAVAQPQAPAAQKLVDNGNDTIMGGRLMKVGIQLDF